MLRLIDGNGANVAGNARRIIPGREAADRCAAGVDTR